MPEPQGFRRRLFQRRTVQPEPSRYELRVNGQHWVSGTLQDVQAYTANVLTSRLNADPEGLAENVQAVLGAFATGQIKAALDQDGTWYTIVGAHTEHPVRLLITDRGE